LLPVMGFALRREASWMQGVPFAPKGAHNPYAERLAATVKHGDEATHPGEAYNDLGWETETY